MTAVLVLFLLADPVPAWLLPPPAKPAPSYRLRQVDHPTLAYVHEGTAFVAEIERDGSVRFRAPSRAPVLHLLPLAVGPTSFGAGSSRADQVRPRPGTVALLKPMPPLPAAPEHRPWLADERCDPKRRNGRAACPEEDTVMVTALSGTFDLNEELASRFAREDPHRTEKARFLSATADLRRTLARRARTRAILAALKDLSRQLEEIGTSPDFTRADKRALLTDIERALTDAGRTAEAAAVAAFQRDRLAQ